MRLKLLPLIACALAGIFADLPAGQASGDPSDVFLDAYTAFQKGEKQESKGNVSGASQSFRDCAEELNTITAKWPTWNPSIVEYRRKRTAEKIANLEQESKRQFEEAQAEKQKLTDDLAHGLMDKGVPAAAGERAKDATWGLQKRLEELFKRGEMEDGVFRPRRTWAEIERHLEDAERERESAEKQLEELKGENEVLDRELEARKKQLEESKRKQHKEPASGRKDASPQAD